MKNFLALYIASLIVTALTSFVCLFILALLADQSQMSLGFWPITAFILALIIVVFIFNLAVLLVFALPFYAVIRKFRKFNIFWMILMSILSATINYWILPLIYAWADLNYIWFLAVGLVFAATFVFINFKLKKRQKKLADYEKLFG